MDVKADDPGFGYRLIAAGCIHATGFQVGENRVQELSLLQGISCTIIKACGPEKNTGPAGRDAHVMRDFTDDSDNVK